MTRQLLAVVFVAVVLSTAIGFTIAGPRRGQANAACREQRRRSGSEAAERPDSRPNTKTDALKRINVQMSTLNTKMNTLNSRTGDTQSAEGTVRALLTIICDYTAPINCKPR